MAGAATKAAGKRAADEPAATDAKKPKVTVDQTGLEEDSGEEEEEEEDSGEEEEEEEDSGEEEEEEDDPLQLDIDNFGRPHGVTGLIDYSFRSLHSALRISDDKSYVQLVQDCETAFTAREIEGAEYSTGTTFFLPATMEPRCVLERMAREVFNFHTRDVKDFNPDKSGAEWWTLVLDAGQTNDDVAFHWDRDYGLEDQYRVNLHPHVGTVTYLSDIGGPTIVLEKISPVQTGSEECGAGEIRTGYVSRPVLGKHISFDGRLLHGAPGDLASVFTDAAASGDKTGVSALQNDRRVTFLVNVWLNHKPIDSELFPEENLAKLACSEKAEINFKLTEAEEAQKPEDAIQDVVSDEAINREGKGAITMLALSFVEASHKMSLMLPMPVKALQEVVRKIPAASSFKVEFPSESLAVLIAGDEVDEGDDGDDDDEGEEDGNDGEEEDEE